MRHGTGEAMEATDTEAEGIPDGLQRLELPGVSPDPPTACREQSSAVFRAGRWSGDTGDAG